MVSSTLPAFHPPFPFLDKEKLTEEEEGCFYDAFTIFIFSIILCDAMCGH